VNVNEAIERDRAQVQAVPGVIDLVYGEDDEGPHALVFVESEEHRERVKRELTRLSLLKECRIVVEEQLLLE
jgi:hypothetical protein